jgi:hypothetical protein
LDKESSNAITPTNETQGIKRKRSFLLSRMMLEAAKATRESSINIKRTNGPFVKSKRKIKIAPTKTKEIGKAIQKAMCLFFISTS